MGQLALQNDIGFHVDCCLGGFFFPFVKLAFKDEELNFDFSVPGVQTISVDTHKYAFGPKGLSVLLFRDKHLKSFLNYHSLWEGGVYHSNSRQDEKPAAIIAGSYSII